VSNNAAMNVMFAKYLKHITRSEHIETYLIMSMYVMQSLEVWRNRILKLQTKSGCLFSWLCFIALWRTKDTGETCIQIWNLNFEFIFFIFLFFSFKFVLWILNVLWILKVTPYYDMNMWPSFIVAFICLSLHK